MSSERALFDADVLAVAGEDVRLSEEFEEAVQEYLKALDDDVDGIAADIRSHVTDGTIVEPLAALGAEDPRTVAELRALFDRLDDPEAAVRLLPPLRLFRTDDVRSDGAPASFVPVPATHLPQLLEVYSPAIVYVWLDDSESSDLAKRDLETVFDEPRTDVMPFAVYGPAYKEVLDREYNLSAGPAILFTRDGEVESRLYGAHGPATIEAELDRHR